MRLYIICKGMKWSHLPNAGGLYDQHPKFMDDMFLVMNVEGEYHRKEAEKNKRQERHKPGMASSGRMKGRRR